MIATYNQAKLLWDCLRYCDRLEPQPDKYIFCENNSQDETLQIIRHNCKHPKELIRFWVRDDTIQKLGNPYGVIAIARQMLLKRARQLDPDYAIFIDSDIMIMYPHFIDQITLHKKDIVGAPYLRPFPKGMLLATTWNRGKEQWYKESCTGFQKCANTSGGCLCLSRKAIQDKRLNFDPPLWNDKRKASEDFSYCIRARKLGYDVWIDCNLKIGHYATASDYKPWMIRKDKEGKNIGYIDFSYGKV